MDDNFLINILNRVEDKIDKIQSTMMTKEDCKANQSNCPLQKENTKLRTWIDIIKESKLLIAAIGGAIVAIANAVLSK